MKLRTAIVAGLLLVVAPPAALPQALTNLTSVGVTYTSRKNTVKPPGDLVKDLGTFDGVERDLRESPFPFELDVHDVANGAYVLTVEVADGATPLATVSLTIALSNGLDEQVSRLESAAKTAPDDLK